MIDLAGPRPKDFPKSDWNAFLMVKIADCAQFIRDRCPDKNRLGVGTLEVDFREMVKTRFYDNIWRTLALAWPRPQESPEEARDRFVATQMGTWERKRQVSLMVAVRPTSLWPQQT